MAKNLDLTVTEELLSEQFAAVLLAEEIGQLTLTPAPAEPVTSDRKVRTATIVAFGDDLGLDLTEWTLVDVLDSLREFGTFGEVRFAANAETGFHLDGMPEGWTFGPKALHYLAFGEWE